jgi:hypothetical protein
MSSQQSSTQQQSQTSPWAPQAAALTSAFSNAGNAYNTASTAVAPTNFTATMTPDQLAVYNEMLGIGTGNTSAGTNAVNTGTGATTSGATGAEGALSSLGAFNPSATNNPSSIINSANEYVQGANIPAQVQQAMVAANQEANEVTNPGIASSAAATGNTNSSRTGLAQGLVDSNLAENAQNMSAALSGQEYNTGLNLAENQASTNNATALSALDAALGGGTSLLSTGAGTTTSGLNDLISALGLGEAGATGQQTNEQEGLTNQEQQFVSGTSSPYAALQGLMSIIGSNNWGSSSTGSSTTTTTPSALQVIGGGLSSLGGLMGSTGVVGGANAGLGSSGIMGVLSALGPIGL